MTASAVSLRRLSPADADGCDAVIASLPYHFGDEDGRAQCARAVRTSAGWVAGSNSRVVGFLTARPWYEQALEITWMAVHADHRRQGIGRMLIQALVDEPPTKARYLVVTTLSAASAETVADGYEGTRRFYRQNGFQPIWDPEGWWNDENQAVLMLRDLGTAG
jgi:ribosomal protein S18 acetylase RimI-like enzyme